MSNPLDPPLVFAQDVVFYVANQNRPLTDLGIRALRYTGRELEILARSWRREQHQGEVQYPYHHGHDQLWLFQEALRRAGFDGHDPAQIATTLVELLDSIREKRTLNPEAQQQGICFFNAAAYLVAAARNSTHADCAIQ